MVVTAVTVFSFSIFRHISYSLIWYDDSYVVMNIVRILQYGYTKVHDGGNVVLSLIS